jgi:hypothetical protein
VYRDLRQELTWEQHMAHQELHQPRLRIDHVRSRVKRCRSVKDRSRLWKVSGRARGRALGYALHNVWVRLTPWQPMMSS